MIRWTRVLLTAIGLCAVLVGGALPASIQAASSSKQNGLLITPVRQFLSVDAGKSVDSKLTIANLTDKPLNVVLSVKQFSVTDYVYDYTFKQPANDWLRLGVTATRLESKESRTVPYNVAAPQGAAPGGRYYTLLASANLSSQGLSSTIQAADLLYLTVNGKLVRTSHLAGSSVQRLALGRSIAYHMQPINTGNVHFFAYVSASVSGPFTHNASPASTHILMPDKIRSLDGSVPSPVFPGVYKLTYGYRTDAGQSVSNTRLVVFMPPWFIAFVLAAFLVAGKFWPRKRKTKTPKNGAETGAGQSDKPSS